MRTRSSMRWPEAALTACLVITLVVSGFTISGRTVVPAARAGGASSCNGVQIRPGDDIQRKIDGRNAGTTFCFHRGVYRLREPIFPRTGDRLIAERGVVLNGSKILTSFDRDGEFWVADDQRQQGPVSGEECMDGYDACVYAETVFVDDRPLWQVASLSELGPGEFYFDYHADKIYLAQDPAGHTVEAGIAPAAIAGYGDAQDRVTVKGFVIEKTVNLPLIFTAAIKPGKSWKIIGNEIRLNSRMAIQLLSGTKVLRNDIHHNGTAGLKGQGDHILIEDNVIAHNNIGGFAFSFSAGARFTSTDHLVVRGNRVVHNEGPGLKTDTDNVDVLFERNRIIGNAGCGIEHETSYDAVIRNNMVKNNCTGRPGGDIGEQANIMIISSPNVEIYGNTVISTTGKNTIGFYDADRGSGPLGAYEVKNAFVHDNVVKMVVGAKTGLQGPDHDAFSTAGNRFNGNTYYLQRREADYWVWEDGLLGRSQWQATGNDTDSRFRRWKRIPASPTVKTYCSASAAA